MVVPFSEKKKKNIDLLDFILPIQNIPYIPHCRFFTSTSLCVVFPHVLGQRHVVETMCWLELLSSNCLPHVNDCFCTNK